MFNQEEHMPTRATLMWHWQVLRGSAASPVIPKTLHCPAIKLNKRRKKQDTIFINLDRQLFRRRSTIDGCRTWAGTVRDVRHTGQPQQSPIFNNSQGATV